MSAVRLQSRVEQRRVTLLTNDTGMLLTARQEGVRCILLPRLDPEPTVVVEDDLTQRLSHLPGQLKDTDDKRVNRLIRTTLAASEVHPQNEQ